MTTYYLVGAFDRHNYGDILFPMVHEQYIQRAVGADAPIEFVAITDADLRDCGGYQTRALKDVLRQKLAVNDRVILCGGDILSADWMLMVAHISSAWMTRPARVMRKVFGIETTNRVVRLLAGEKNLYPYVISDNDTQASIYYTSVGGAGFKSAQSNHFRSVVKQLRSAASISVRDHKIEKLLKSEGLDVRCTPDTALVMSDYFTLEMLDSRDWKRQIRTTTNFDYRRYYSFQGAKRLLENHLEQLQTEIIKVHDQTGYAPMMVPIGRAPDHEDHLPLESLYNRLVKAGIPCAIQDSEHVLDIMASLAFAETYVGTSLHGAITTYSFGHKPCALFSTGVKKLQDFLHSWLDQEDFRLYPEPRFAENLIELINVGGKIGNTSRLEENKKIVEQELAAYI